MGQLVGTAHDFGRCACIPMCADLWATLFSSHMPCATWLGQLGWQDGLQVFDVPSWGVMSA